MSGEIGNKALLRERAERLQMLDSKVYPGRLATDIVQPVQEVDPQYLGPTPSDDEVYYNTALVNLGGIPSTDFELYPATALGRKSRVNCIHLALDVPIDASPASVQIGVYYQLPVGQAFRFLDFLPATVTSNEVATSWRYATGGGIFAYPLNTAYAHGAAGWMGYVPNQVPLRIVINRLGGAGNFPVASQLRWSVFASQWNAGELAPYT